MGLLEAVKLVAEQRWREAGPGDVLTTLRRPAITLAVADILG